MKDALLKNGTILFRALHYLLAATAVCNRGSGGGDSDEDDDDAVDVFGMQIQCICILRYQIAVLASWSRPTFRPSLSGENNCS